MPLSGKQKRIFHFIRFYFQEHFEAPTMAEIGREFQVSSPATVHWHLTKLEDEGQIIRTPHVSRGIQLVEKL